MPIDTGSHYFAVGSIFSDLYQAMDNRKLPTTMMARSKPNYYDRDHHSTTAYITHDHLRTSESQTNTSTDSMAAAAAASDVTMSSKQSSHAPHATSYTSYSLPSSPLSQRNGECTTSAMRFRTSPGSTMTEKEYEALPSAVQKKVRYNLFVYDSVQLRRHEEQAISSIGKEERNPKDKVAPPRSSDHTRCLRAALGNLHRLSSFQHETASVNDRTTFDHYHVAKRPREVFTSCASLAQTSIVSHQKGLDVSTFGPRASKNDTWRQDHHFAETPIYSPRFAVVSTCLPIVLQTTRNLRSL